MHDSNLKYRGLEETPKWRWALYLVLLFSLALFLGLKFHISIFIGTLVGSFILVCMFVGIDKLFKNPQGQSWLKQNYKFLLALFILGQIVLVVWDNLASR